VASLVALGKKRKVKERAREVRRREEGRGREEGRKLASSPFLRRGSFSTPE